MILNKHERQLRVFRSQIYARAFSTQVTVPLQTLFDQIDALLDSHQAWQAVRVRSEDDEDVDLDSLPTEELSDRGVRAIIRVADVVRDEEARSVALLVQWVDIDEADPAYSSLGNPAVRIPDKAEDEGRTHSAHVVFAMDETDGEHTVVIEDAARLSPTKLHGFFRHLLLTIHEVEVSDSHGRKQRRKPVFKMEGVPDARLQEEFEAGYLTSIELVRQRPVAERFDEAGAFREDLEVIRLKPHSKRPTGEEAKQVVRRALLMAKDKGFEKFRVRYADPRSSSKAVTFDAHVQDALERAFVKAKVVQLEDEMAECVQEVQPQILTAAHAMLYV